MGQGDNNTKLFLFYYRHHITFFQAVIQSVAVQLAGSVITSNKLKLDLNSIAKSTVASSLQ
jgi:hypothetical protein